jgi:hypothetical protein
LIVRPEDFTTVLRALGATGGQVVSAAELAFGCNRALTLTTLTPEGLAGWLATLTQESDHLRTTTEYGTGQVYAPYVGRTFQQLTWRDNYAAFGDWTRRLGLTGTGDLFLANAGLLAELQWAWLGGVWFFGDRNLWGPVSRGDFQTVQNAVNRGVATSSGYPSGWAARLACYRAWTAQVAPPVTLDITGSLDTPTARRLQQWVGVGIDGSLGAVTWSAVQKWLGVTVDGSMSAADTRKLQAVIGAYVDGAWGPGTTRDLQMYLNGATAAGFQGGLSEGFGT